MACLARWWASTAYKCFYGANEFTHGGEDLWCGVGVCGGERAVGADNIVVATTVGGGLGGDGNASAVGVCDGNGVTDQFVVATPRFGTGCEAVQCLGG